MREKHNSSGYRNSIRHWILGLFAEQTDSHKTKTIQLPVSMSSWFSVGLVCLLLLSCTMVGLITNSAVAYAVDQTSYNLTSGNSYYVELESLFYDTSKWAGIKVIASNSTLSESIYPFLSSAITVPIIVEAAFPGYNHQDNDHFYVAMFADNFSTQGLRNISYADLLNDSIFDSTDFPQFYPDYLGYSDNPNATFCCNLTSIYIGGINTSVFAVELDPFVSEYNQFYVAMYNDGSEDMPMFLTENSATTCYNTTSCVGQFILPFTTRPYNFYSIHALGAYNFTVLIDGVVTNTMNRTATPYNLTLLASNLYAGTIAANTPVVVGENDGQSIFVPYRLTGYVSKGYSVGQTDNNGYESFIVTPTVYPSTSNYSFFVAAYIDGSVTSEQEVYIDEPNVLVQQSKSLAVSSVYDNVKAVVNAMNQINSYLFRWTSQLEEAKRIDVYYDDYYGNFSFVTDPANGTSFTMQTGAPYVVRFYGMYNNVATANYLAQVHETDGYLLLNPYTETSPLTDALPHHLMRFPNNTEIIFVPTSLGVVNSTVEFEVYDSNNTFINSTTAYIIPTLDTSTGGVSYSNDLLKTVVNAMNQVLYTLYIALNT